MNKYIKICVLFLGVFIIAFVLKNILTPPIPEQIKRYLNEDNYTIDKDDNSLLYKYVSGDTINYFNIADYTFSQSINENSDIVSSLNQTYNFKTEKLSYNYRIVYSNNINVLFKGEYDSNNYSCIKEFSTASISENEINNICSLIRIKAERFYDEAKTLFNNYNFIEYMKNVKVEE